MAEEQHGPPFWVDFIAGTVAGTASLFCGHPFDTVKVVVQCADGQRAGSWHALRSLVSATGVAGLYRGVTSPLFGVAAVNSVVFGSYGIAMRLQLDHPADSPTLMQYGVAGSASGAVTALITTPIERLKVLQQCASTSGPQPRVVDLLKSMSLARLYRGFGATVLRDLGYGPYFMTYEAICRGWPGPMRHESKANLLDEIENEARTVPWTRVLCAGAAAGVVGWTVTFPLDVIKSKMQATERRDVNGRKTNQATIWSTAVSSYKHGGYRVFVAGLWPTIIRAVPVNIVTFLAYETSVTAMTRTR